MLRDPITAAAGRPTVRDVAAAAGVSVATVDRVLNRRAPVKAETARRVLEAARALRFHASPLLARRLEERAEEWRFGFLLQRRSDSFYQGLGEALTEAVRQTQDVAGRAIVAYQDDLAPQHLGEALHGLSRKCDAVALVAADHPRITQAVEALRAAGIPVFTLLSDIATPARTGFIGIDHRKAGRTAAWTIARIAARAGAPRPDGTVGILVGSHRYLGQELCEISFRSYFREHAPGFRLLDALMTLEDNRLSHEVTLELLHREPALVGLYVAGGGMEGVIGALREHGGYDSIVVVCNELIPETRAALIDGVVDLVIATPVTALARRTVQAMRDALAGRASPAEGPLAFELCIAETI